MSHTLLDGVNEILTRVSVISGDSGKLTSLTDSARQSSIDVAIQVINEGVDELYSVTSVARPTEEREDTISLLLDTRDYALATGLVQIRWPMIDYDNTQHIKHYPGGWDQMRIDDSGSDQTGLPHYATIRPTDGKLYIDSRPQSGDVGRVYTYRYDTDLSLSVQTDTFPFTDTVFRAMVPAWVQLWKRDRRNEMDQGIFNFNIGRAARLFTQGQMRTSYSPRRRAS